MRDAHECQQAHFEDQRNTRKEEDQREHNDHIMGDVLWGERGKTVVKDYRIMKSE